MATFQVTNGLAIAAFAGRFAEGNALAARLARLHSDDCLLDERVGMV